MVTAERQRIVLMADDDEEDCFLAKTAFEASGAKASFSCVEDGMALMEYLSEGSRSSPNRLPDLLLLDLNMPRKDGRESLLEIKCEPVFRHIPIVILTTSETEKDIAFSMKAGANSFITKPASFDEWVEIMKSLAALWLGR